MYTAALQGFVRERVERGAMLYMDEAAAYRGMREYRHEDINHSVGEYVRDMAHTNRIESFWAMLKCGYRCAFNYFREKHLDRNVTEFAKRYNICSLDTIDTMERLPAEMVGKWFRYAYVVA